MRIRFLSSKHSSQSLEFYLLVCPSLVFAKLCRSDTICTVDICLRLFLQQFSQFNDIVKLRSVLSVSVRSSICLMVSNRIVIIIS